MTTLAVRHLYKIFGRRPQQAMELLKTGADAEKLRDDGYTAAVVDASLEIHSGELFVVMGLSGSGKSTLIRMLNGLLTPTSGSVEIDGTDLTALSAKQLRALRQERISMVFQHFALLPHRTVGENAAYGPTVRGLKPTLARRKALEALDLVGLSGWENRYPTQLSGGMRQRVGLARALAADTDILLMDEAFSALDPLIRRDMQDQLLALQRELGKTIVFITHDLNEAMRLGDRIAMLRDGRITQVGTAKEILHAPANDYVARFVADVDRSRVLTAADVATTPVPAVAPSATAEQIRLACLENNVAAVHVVDDGRLVGTADANGSTAQKFCVPAETLLADVVTEVAGAVVPLAVVDADGVPIGVLTADALLAALGSPRTSGAPPESTEESAAAKTEESSAHV